MRHALKNTLRNAAVAGTALCLLAALPPAATAQPTDGPCFVAGDALGVDLHVVAVLALATPSLDPMEFHAFPIELAARPTAPVQLAQFKPTTPRQAHATPVTMTQTLVAAPHPWTLFASLATWLTVAPPSFDDATLWMAIVN